MRGKIFLRVKTNRVSYDLQFNRKISIIKGDSGIGKTTLISLISSYLQSGKKSGVHLSTNAQNIKVLNNSVDWEYELSKSNNDTLFIADENVQYILSKSFSEKLKTTSCYLVYISRSGKTGYLQYAISDIYGLCNRNNSNFSSIELYNIYNNYNLNFSPDLIITEDSKSGKDILSHIIKRPVLSFHGKDNVVNFLSEQVNVYNNIYIIIDGAAFGNQIQRLVTDIKSYTSNNIYIFAPESFEYLLLKTSKFVKFCSNELSHTEDFIDYSKYNTWENYFEALLIDLCKSKYKNVSYEKVSWEELNPFFKQKSLLIELQEQLTDLNDDVFF